MVPTTRSGIALGAWVAACAAGLLFAGPAAADETTPPAPQLDQPCAVGVALPDPFTCDPVTQLVALLPVPVQPAVVAVPAAPAAAPVASPAPVVSSAPVPAATRPTAPAATAPAQPAPAPTRTSGPTATPVVPVASAPARPATLLQTAKAPATPASAGLTAQRFVGPSAESLTALPLSALPPAQALAAVQEPLLAAGNDAAGDGGFQLAAVSGATLPGLLVVLGTAAVAAAAVGNVRAWELRRVPVRRQPAHQQR